eukprot:gnl/TRDRNA2_/TRDRNA2_174326_c0_seq6.p1 gnl/TRDRNA2_/TRDRNA2_174326_c0~~gnl/TRDRNA2_/TRDRNA2_174326_c0_seq6.p1  ORF type:complete len:227 (-),score=28.65 gnl/TRDRNA2_/TRDRNA2_174326_c0_seq6:103-783(-)
MTTQRRIRPFNYAEELQATSVSPQATPRRRRPLNDAEELHEQLSPRGKSVLLQAQTRSESFRQSALSTLRTPRDSSARSLSTSRGGLGEGERAVFDHGRLRSAETLGEVHHMLTRPEARTGPPDTVKEFKAALIKKFGKLEYAWHEMDTNTDGVLQFHEFVAVCRRIQFAGNLKKIFTELGGKDGVVTPGSLDPDLPAALKDLCAEDVRKARVKSGRDAPQRWVPG